MGLHNTQEALAKGPACINYIKVYEGNIETDVNGLTYDLNLTNQQLAKLQNDSIRRAINWAIGHEIGHALGAEHFDGIGPIREDPNKTGASIMRSYVNVQSRTTVDNIGDPIYYTVPETVVRGSHHYLPRHDTEYKLVPDGVSLTSPETASESRPLPNFPMLSLDPSKFPNDASCGGTLVAPPNDQSTDTVPPPPTGLSLSAGNGQVSRVI